MRHNHGISGGWGRQFDTYIDDGIKAQLDIGSHEGSAQTYVLQATADSH
jgi:hypothetical protein